jgi:2-phospho-L-lactate guanylyltransferase
VPFKGPVGSKRRLAGLLNETERASLSLAMLDGVLDALLATPGIERVLLLRPADAIRWPVSHPRLTFLDEIHESDGVPTLDNLNGALRQAQAHAESHGAAELLIVPGDLPLVRPDDIGAVLDAALTASLAIAPDRAGGGTNALLLAPPSALPPSFGEASFARHRSLASTAGLEAAVVERLGLALDLDTPADVALLLASGHDCRAARLLRDLGVPRRLAELADRAAQARSTRI